MCRAKAPRKSIIKQLYFNSANTSICSQDSPNAALSKYKNKCSTLESQSIELRSEVTKLKEQLEETNSLFSRQTKKLKAKLDQVQIQKCRLDNMKDELSNTKMRNNSLEATVKRLQRLEKDAELIRQMSQLADGDDTNDYVDKLIARGDLSSLKRYNDQIQRAFQQKCTEQRKLERDIEHAKHEVNRQKRIISNYEEEQVTVQVKLKNAEKALEAAREKNKIITENINTKDTSMFNRLITESPLSDDLLARVQRNKPGLSIFITSEVSKNIGAYR